jgi:phosphonopyruvate decarboxylase
MSDPISPDSFLNFLEENDFSTITGVPCSYFKDFLVHLSSMDGKTTIKHFLATREDEALGIASGVAFTSNRAIVYLQNSGLGNIGDALTSLAQLYKLPMLLLISYRGLLPDKDFPEHSIMGEVSEAFLKALKVPYLHLTKDNWREEMNDVIEKMEEIRSPVALLVKSGVLSK